MRENPINKILFHVKDKVGISLAVAHWQNLTEPNVENEEVHIDHPEDEESVGIFCG